jgi:cytoskeletal protein CcmA (bactofilin family)
MRNPYLAGLFTFLAVLAFGVSAQANTPDPASGAVEWQVGSTLFLAGRDFNVSRKISGSLTATGQTISINNETTVADDVWIAGRHVAIEGKIGGDLTIRSEDALINGVVKGNVSFYGVSLAFGPDARIEGDVDYFAALPATLDKGATIKGAMKSSVLRDAPVAPEIVPQPDYRKRFQDRERWTTPDRYYSWWGAVSLAIVAGLVAALWPRAAVRLVDATSGQNITAIAYGLIWFVLGPVVAIIALFTIIGLPLAMILVLLFPLTVVAGIIAFILAVGRLIDQRMTFVEDGLARHLAGVIIATFLLRFCIALPGIGMLVWVASVCFGMGALFMATRTRLTDDAKPI